MRLSALIAVMTLSAFTCFGQAKGTKKPKPKEKSAGIDMIIDRFKGSIAIKDSLWVTELMLEHQLFADDGTFTLRETLEKPVKTNAPVETKGDWTVLRGDATNENATVVEIDGAGKTQFYLRLKNEDLQRLDASLHKLKHAKGNTPDILKKQKN
jgi:NlpE N-terminal domain